MSLQSRHFILSIILWLYTTMQISDGCFRNPAVRNTTSAATGPVKLYNTTHLVKCTETELKRSPDFICMYGACMVTEYRSPTGVFLARDNSTRICHCIEEYTGTYCDEPNKNPNCDTVILHLKITDAASNLGRYPFHETVVTIGGAQIVGIVLGCVLLLILVVIGVWFLIRYRQKKSFIPEVVYQAVPTLRRSRQNTAQSNNNNMNKPPELDEDEPPYPVDDGDVSQPLNQNGITVITADSSNLLGGRIKQTAV